MQFSQNGIINGCYYGQNDRVDELNDRVSERQFSDTPLRPNFDPRPVPTKYSLFPVIDRKTPIQEPAQTYLDDNGFSPATRNGPPRTYLRNIDVETVLRNQTVALQHGADQGKFVPSTHSDLYRVSVASRQGPPQPHPDLFTRQVFETSPNSITSEYNVGNQTIYNHTRTQLRNSIQMS